MIRSRFTSLVMAIGLVLIYFFIEGLSFNIDQVFQQIKGERDLTPVEAHEVSTVTTFELPTKTVPDEEPLPDPVETEFPIEATHFPEIDPLAYRAPSQTKRSNQIAPLGDPETLSETPLRLVIPTIELDAPILPVKPELVNLDGVNFEQWGSPDEFAAGWHESSAKLGEIGNTVLNGHHNIYGEVFKRLIELNQNDLIEIYSDQFLFTYQVTNKMVFPEQYESLDVRIKNAQWILPSQDERLTLITCWPYWSNTHRLIIVAKPLSVEELPQIDQELIPRIVDEDH